MELKVWVEGIQRIVCGVTVNTTCQDVVFALAHATGKVGRFTLIERWRNNERLLAPNENPMRLLMKWGEYANDVQFILQRSENKQQQQQQQQHQGLEASNEISNNNANANNNIKTTNAVMTKKQAISISNNNNKNNNSSSSNGEGQRQQEQPAGAAQLKKSFGAYDVKHSDNVGIVKGIPQRPSLQQSQQHSQKATTASLSTPLMPKHEKSHSNPIEMPHMLKESNNKGNNNYNQHQQHIYSQIGLQNSKSINEINLAEVRNSLERQNTNVASNMLISGAVNSQQPNQNQMVVGGSDEFLFIPNPSSMATSNENLLESYNANNKYNGSSNNNNDTSEIYKNEPTISANGALVPPPYRNPPPPRNSPMQQQQLPHRLYGGAGDNKASVPHANNNNNNNPFMLQTNEYASNNNNSNNGNDFDMSMEYQPTLSDLDNSESIFQATQYNDLLQLIKYQREKITNQQMELNKYDAEIVYLEAKERDQAQELEAISREITKADQLFRQGSEQLQSLQYVEEENELVKQQEKTLKSEIALLRSKLLNCETELLQCKNKMRLLMDDIELEQRAISNKQKSNRQNIERDFLMEMERIQSEIDQAIHSTDNTNKTSDNLKKEILIIENAIAEKKRQVEQLVNEMKEVNLQSLQVATSEEIKQLLEGPHKPGSSRRIIGSPRQLENAVPTSKNPHGVWV